MNLFETPFLSAYVLIISAALGSVMGSFITCMADRISAGEDWKHGRSHCDVCHHELHALDLIPIFSYLIHKGKCRYCGTKLSSKYFWTEVGMAVLFMLVTWHYHTLTFLIVRDWGLISVLLGISIVDMKTYTIPDGMILAGIIIWLMGVIYTALVHGDWVHMAVDGLLGGVLIAGSLLLLSLIMDHILGKESLGGGDIKLLFMTSLYTGALEGLFSLMLACITGLVFVVLLKRNKIPFGPSISIAACITLFTGTYVVQWYTGLF